MITKAQRVVLYHDHCMDGFTAAWAAYRAFGLTDTVYQAVRHGEPPPNVAGLDVLIVDFSYSRDVLLDMEGAARAQGRSVRVLDHHKTAQEDLRGLSFATFDMKRSGAGLTWDTLHPGIERPWIIDYVEDRDLWLHKLPDSEEVNAWLWTQDQSFHGYDQIAINYTTNDAATLGQGCLAYAHKYVSEMKPNARTLRLFGHEVPVVNAPGIGISELVGALAEDHPFAVGWHQRADGLYSYSLRSRGDGGLDVSALAKKMSGGGHRNAAGFTSDLEPGALSYSMG